MSCERLPLDGLYNARDLGGFRAIGGITKCGVFIRSDVPAFISESDSAFLRDCGLKNVVDLRSAHECAEVPDALSRTGFVTYISVPMYDRAAASGACEKAGKPSGFSWAAHYIRMTVEHKRWMRDVLEALSSVRGCTLFHCATGKDRTGLVAMALLGLCGVSDADIIADYEVSQRYLQPLIERQASSFGKQPDDPFFSTAPENMALLLDHINSEYGGVSGYLLSCGASKSLLTALRERLLQSV